jgi:hypothetical protein
LRFCNLNRQIIGLKNGVDYFIIEDEIHVDYAFSLESKTTTYAQFYYKTFHCQLLNIFLTYVFSLYSQDVFIKLSLFLTKYIILTS